MATIQQRIGKNGKITYRIKVSCGYTYDHKQIIKSMTFVPDDRLTPRKALKEAHRQAFIFEEQCKEETNNANHTTFETLAEEWLNIVRQTKSQKKSSIVRLECCEKRTYQVIGNLDVDKINFRQIQSFVLSLSKKGANAKTGMGLSTKSQKHYLTFISSVMKYAIQCGFRKDNPCQGVTVVKKKAQEKDIYSLDEVKAILSALHDKAPIMHTTLFSIIAYLGLRRAEVLGLEYKDFDFNNHTVQITRTYNYCGSENGSYTDTPKTQKSCRTLSVPSILIELLKQLHTQQEQDAKNCGDLWHKSDRVFVNEFGQPIHPNTPYNWLNKFCKRNDLPFKGIHSFRHSFATQAIVNGTDVSTVSSILGHSQTSTTLNIYTHSVQAVNDKAMEDIANLLNA